MNWMPKEQGDGDPRALFDAAFDAASKAETLQRLDGLTRALPVATIRPAVDFEAIAADLAQRIELAVRACRDENLGNEACRQVVLLLLDPQNAAEDGVTRMDAEASA